MFAKRPQRTLFRAVKQDLQASPWLRRINRRWRLRPAIRQASVPTSH
jgi:hypothetical protein